MIKKYILTLFVLFTINGFAQVENDKETIYAQVDQLPEFPDGEKQLHKYIQKHLNFPQSAVDNKTYGKCFIQFVIKSDGSIGKIKVLKGVPDCPDCDREATRVISGMPRWKPAMKDGKAVSSYFNLPLNFEKR